MQDQQKDLKVTIIDLEKTGERDDATYLGDMNAQLSAVISEANTFRGKKPPLALGTDIFYESDAKGGLTQVFKAEPITEKGYVVDEVYKTTSALQQQNWRAEKFAACPDKENFQWPEDCMPV